MHSCLQFIPFCPLVLPPGIYRTITNLLMDPGSGGITTSQKSPRCLPGLRWLYKLNVPLPRTNFKPKQKYLNQTKNEQNDVVWCVLNFGQHPDGFHSMCIFFHRLFVSFVDPVHTAPCLVVAFATKASAPSAHKWHPQRGQQKVKTHLTNPPNPENHRPQGPWKACFQGAVFTWWTPWDKLGTRHRNVPQTSIGWTQSNSMEP